MLRLTLILLITFALLNLLAISVARAVPPGARISFELTRGDNTDLYALDGEKGILHNLTRDPADDFGGAWHGTRMVFVSNRSGIRQLYLLTIGGGLRRLDDQMVAPNFRPVWSPDGCCIVYEVERYNTKDLHLIEVDAPLISGENPRPLTETRTDDRFAVWSPDGEQIAFVSWREGSAGIFTIDPDGSSLLNLTNNEGWSVSPSWSPDGSEIAFFSIRNRYRELYVMNRDGGDLRQLSFANQLSNGYFWTPPVWSPDGSEIAYQTVIDGNAEIVTAATDGASMRRLTDAPALDAVPLWLPDARHIIFMSARSGHDALYIMDTDGSNVRALTPSDADSRAPVLWK
jgi:Tol biopolymer transport system component